MNTLELGRNLQSTKIRTSELLQVPTGEITEQGIRKNILVGIKSLEALIRENRSVPLYDLMEDAATVEICRSQLWQWIHHRATMKDGGRVNAMLVKMIMRQELQSILNELGEEKFEQGEYLLASEILGRMITSDNFPDFLTNSSYQHVLRLEEKARA
ncbi:MAG: hypothetical protein ACYCQJ_13965 [Nitrososphaerales archaeon]